MLQKVMMTHLNGHSPMQVTFMLPADLWAESVHLVGDFNDWSRDSHPMERDRAGRWSLTLVLERDRAIQFRYLINLHNWTNDDAADAYVRNIYGTDNSVVITDPKFVKHCEE